MSSRLKNVNKLFFDSSEKAIDEYDKILLGLPEGELKRCISFNMFLLLKREHAKENIFFKEKQSAKKIAIEKRKNGRYWECVFYWEVFFKKGDVKSQEYKEILANIDELIVREAYQESKYLIDIVAPYLPGNKNILQQKGRIYLCESDFSKAKENWMKYWDAARQSSDFRDARVAKIENSRYPNETLFDVLSPAEASDKVKGGSKVCFYTALFGGYDQLPDLLYKPEGVDFICFSDTYFEANGWEVRVVDIKQNDPILENRKYKICPHKYLGEYDYSCYVDSNIMFVGRIETLLDRWLLGHDFVAWGHPDRSDIYSEMQAILSSLRHSAEGLIEQYEWFKKQGVPAYTGLIEACFLWRKHSSKSVQSLMDQWWDFVSNSKVKRDQPPLAYLMWKTNIRPSLLPKSLGNTRENEFFFKAPHAKHPVSGSLFESKDKKILSNTSQ
ncbi:glycosyltransferase domain-containing protein, partial [Vreelandella stevensii]|uniref:glycosyltransferase domain-containing protein n=1 Tax=Vreelandella stevensii TaxID=502821 RepID=UPI0012E9C49A